MQGNFEMSMMEKLNFILSLQNKQEKKKNFINQTKYIKQIIKKFEINDRSVRTPKSNTCKLCKDEEGKRVDQKLYRVMIGSLLYLMASRPDIMFSMCMRARFQSDPRESHLIDTKRIFRYLVST